MAISKELKYNIIFAILLMFIGETWDYSNDLIFNQSRNNWFKPGSIILFITFNIAYFSVYVLNYLVFAPRFLKPRTILQYSLSFVLMILCFAGLRFFLEEILLLHLFDFNNYNLDRTNIVAIYFADSAIYAFPAVLFSSLMYLFFRFNENKSRVHDLELQHQEAQMAMLKSQISPHFMFNTLNGFYSELYEKQPEIANDILKLSNLLRYVTYDAKENYMPLDKEIVFIEDYLYFYKRRYEDEFYVNFEVYGSSSHKKVPALLLIHFVENLTKHGIINDSTNPALIKIHIYNSHLELITKNVINPSEKYMDKGIGSKNVMKRLELVFKDKYTLTNMIDGEVYNVYLKFPI